MRRKSLLLLFSGIFSILLLVVFAVLFALRPVLSFSDFLSVESFSIPVLLYILMVLLLVSLIISWVAHSVLRKQENLLKDRLHWLYLGNYTQTPATEKTDKSVFLDHYGQSVFEEVELLRKKMIGLSREVQQLSALPRLIGDETKEEILENERHRIARELHDSVSQQLFAAMMMLSAINEKAAVLPENTQRQLKLVEAIINESQSEMRALLLHLRPVKLEGKSLKKGIEQLLVELKSKVQIKIKWEIDDVQTMDGIEDHLFRIVQELLSNTLRHAKASNLEVYLKQTTQEISLRIFDDGVGFDPADEKTGSYGLMNIKERVKGMGGTCKIISFPKKGTIIEIRIPDTKKMWAESNERNEETK